MPATVVALEEMEKGNLDLDAPVVNYCPEFDEVQVLTGFACDRASTDTLALGPGYKWGYGLLLNTQDLPGMRRAWSGAWAGLCNTHFWVDRTAGVCASIYSNSLPFVTPGALGLYQDFERALYAAL